MKSPITACLSTCMVLHPFGMITVGRSWEVGSEYRYGFQKQEKLDNIYGINSTSAFKYRMYDCRIGKFLSLDPLSGKYPFNSPYAFSENQVINAIELEGLEKIEITEVKIDGVTVQLNYNILNDPNDGANPIVNTTIKTCAITPSGNVNKTSEASVEFESTGVLNVVNALNNSTNPNMQNGATLIKNNAYSGNTPESQDDLIADIIIPCGNQFDQGLAVSNITNPLAPPAFSTNLSNILTNGNPLIGTFIGNTTKILVMTDGSVIANANAQAQVMILQAAFPSVQFAIAAVPGLTSPTSAGFVNVFFNPTQQTESAFSITPLSYLPGFQFTGLLTPLIPPLPFSETQLK